VHFYANYVSMRYVREKLVFRLRTTPSEAVLEELHKRYAKLLVSGKFEVRKALSAESDEPELADLPRLVFQFNRRDHGLLRQMINYLNVKLA
jgi:hypothetical protein